MTPYLRKVEVSLRQETSLADVICRALSPDIEGEVKVLSGSLELLYVAPSESKARAYIETQVRLISAILKTLEVLKANGRTGQFSGLRGKD